VYRLFFHFLKFEGKRVFFDKKNLLFFVIITALALYFTLSGINEYRRFRNDEANFIHYEREKIGKYVNYSQYGAYGFRLLYAPSPLIVFFGNSSVLQELESNIDVTEIIKVSHSFKGKNLFLYRGYFKDFSGVIFLFGSLFMLYMGMSCFKSLAYVKFMVPKIGFYRYFFLTALSRLLVLSLLFLLLIGGCWLAAILAGVRFSPAEKASFAVFGLMALVYLDFFFLAGMAMTLVFRFRSHVFAWLFILWFAFVFLIPEIGRISLFNRSQSLVSDDAVNLEKLKTVMTFERKMKEQFNRFNGNTKQRMDLVNRAMADYINNSFLFNETVELRLTQEMRKLIHLHQGVSLIFPSTYFSLAAGEISSRGYWGYLDFVDFIMKIRREFLKYYLNKNYLAQNREVLPFIYGEQAIFRGRSRLPGGFWTGLALTAAYCACFLLASLFFLRKLVYRP
jgi:hypothetical protein